MSPEHRVLCGIISALQTYDFYIIGSPSPYIFIAKIDQFCSYGPEKDNFHTDFLKASCADQVS